MDLHAASCPSCGMASASKGKEAVGETKERETKASKEVRSEAKQVTATVAERAAATKSALPAMGLSVRPSVSPTEPAPAAATAAAAAAATPAVAPAPSSMSSTEPRSITQQKNDKRKLPRVIYMIRHLHKDEQSPSGGLSALGNKHATMLHRVFNVLLANRTLPPPTHLFAQWPRDLLVPHNSTSVNRVYETMRPLAERMKLPIVSRPEWNRHAYAEVVSRYGN